MGLFDHQPEKNGVNPSKTGYPSADSSGDSWLVSKQTAYPNC